MRIHLLACRVLTRELSYYAAKSPQTVDITWLPQGLHDTPDRLRSMLQTAIQGLEADIDNGLIKHQPDAVVLGYGLCSNGVVGLQAGRYPLVVPRTDDCIALFLGSQSRYLELFAKRPGTFWLNNGWIESAYLPMPEALEQKRAEYAQRYGEDNAQFLIEQDMLWVEHYQACGYIRSPRLERDGDAQTAKRLAQDAGWRYFTVDGSERLLEKMVRGEWNEEEFLFCPPGFQIEAAYDGSKIKAANPGREEVAL